LKLVISLKYPFFIHSPAIFSFLQWKSEKKTEDSRRVQGFMGGTQKLFHLRNWKNGFLLVV